MAAGAPPKSVVAVGSFPQSNSPFGCMDMAGNAREWTAGVESSTSQTVSARGGSWRDAASHCLATFRSLVLRTERDGPWWVLWLDAPASRNALTDAMVSGLQQALNDAAQDPTVRAVLLRGAGGTFCAGGDFSRFRSLMAEPAPAQSKTPGASAAPDYSREDLRKLQSTLFELTECRRLLDAALRDKS